jgi:hypothetical protein
MATTQKKVMIIISMHYFIAWKVITWKNKVYVKNNFEIQKAFCNT